MISSISHSKTNLNLLININRFLFYVKAEISMLNIMNLVSFNCII